MLLFLLLLTLFGKTCEGSHHQGYCHAVTKPSHGNAKIFGNTGSTVGHSNKITVGTIIEFWCNSGYVLKGSKYIKCLSSRNYNGTVPQCRRKGYCKSVHIPQNGNASIYNNTGVIHINFGNTVGMIIEFRCSSGYVLNGPKYIKCLSSESYNASVPSCKTAECTNPTLQENSKLLSNKNMFAVGTIINITCDSGYRLKNGSLSLTCNPTGQWNGYPPTCQAIRCLSPNVLNNGHYLIEKTNSCNVQSLENAYYQCNIRVQCNVGYKKRNCGNGGERSCLDTGKWSEPDCFCEKVQCFNPGLLKYGSYHFPNGTIFINVADFNTSISIDCESGYESHGPYNRTCQSNGTWSGNAQVCIVVSCKHSGNFLYGSYTFANHSYYKTGDLNFNAKIFVNCKTGFENLSKGIRICTSNKTWSGESPICSIMVCKYPGDVSNGRYVFQNGSEVVSSETTFGTIIDVMCDTGYENKGGHNRTCGYNSTWTGEKDACSMIKCEHSGLHAIKDGSYMRTNGGTFTKGTANFSETIRVICKTGFVLASGSKTRSCLANRTWSGQGVKCTKIVCPAPNVSSGVLFFPFLNNSTPQYLFGDNVTAACEQGFFLKGSSFLRCNEHGTWEGDMSVCETVTSTLQSTSTGPIIGGASSAAVVLIASILVLVYVGYRKRRQSVTKQNKSEIPTKHPDIQQSPGGTGEYDEIKETTFGASGKSGSYLNLGEIGRMEVQPSTGIYSNTSAEESDQAYYSFDLSTTIPKHAIMVKDLSDLVLTGDGAKQRFRAEFENLPQGMTEKYSVAMKSQNRRKNKYKNLYAYDRTRIVLKKDPKLSSDYINACYMHGFSTIKAYIAAQGPMTNTLEDFWRMMWQEKSSKIVMLTNLCEEGKDKCEKYWPDSGSLTYGEITVTLKKTEIFSEFVIRNLTMQKGKNAEENVTHFHFTAWPDKGVPKYASSLVKFRNKVKHAPMYGNGPIVVHCSAGIGRTGTFVALDFLTDQANALNYLDVAGTVETLRKQRVNMVQTLEQYIFVHFALVETLMLSTSALPASQFQDAYKCLRLTDEKSHKRKINLEYEMLRKLSPVLEESQYVSATVVRNRQKNRHSDIIPVDEFMPPLTSDDGKQTDYVNAVYLPSYKERKAFIITQTPLETTRDDFWRLVWEHNIHTIVMMNNSNEMINSEIYWPNEGEATSFGNIDIANDGAVEMSHHQVVSLTASKSQMIRCLKQFQFGGWKSGENLPESPELVLSLMELVRGWQQQTENHTILVHCMNGVDKSGLFCVISAVIERMKIEQDVAISHVIEEMRNAREQIIPSVEQYQFCHEVVLTFMEQNETYANFTA